MQTKEPVVKIALADDHLLLRSALTTLIDNFGNCKVIIQAENGNELVERIQPHIMPDIVLLDLNMPHLDGYDTAVWLRDQHPDVHVLMLTMYDAEAIMIRLLQAGVKGFLKKDVHPSELRFAIQSVMQHGYYYSHTTTGKLVNLFRNGSDINIQKNMLTSEEVVFLKFASTDMTYKEIAVEMGLNPRSVDNLRDHLFEKLDVKSRVGLAMYAIRQGLVRL
jgi:two-component system, NarL family, invasion response regulator UvrY